MKKIYIVRILLILQTLYGIYDFKTTLIDDVLIPYHLIEIRNESNDLKPITFMFFTNAIDNRSVHSISLKNELLIAVDNNEYSADSTYALYNETTVSKYKQHEIIYYLDSDLISLSDGDYDQGKINFTDGSSIAVDFGDIKVTSKPVIDATVTLLSSTSKNSYMLEYGVVGQEVSTDYDLMYMNHFEKYYQLSNNQDKGFIITSQFDQNNKDLSIASYYIDFDTYSTYFGNSERKFNVFDIRKMIKGNRYGKAN